LHNSPDLCNVWLFVTYLQAITAQSHEYFSNGK